MTTNKSGAIASAWQSGLDFQAPRPASNHRAPRGQTAGRQSSATAHFPSTRRGTPPPLEDDIDVLGGLVLVLMFLIIVWL